MSEEVSSRVWPSGISRSRFLTSAQNQRGRTYRLACSILMKLTPILTSTVKVPSENSTHPDSSLPSAFVSLLSTPLREIPPSSKGCEKRATKYPLNPLAGRSSPSSIRLMISPQPLLRGLTPASHRSIRRLLACFHRLLYYPGGMSNWKSPWYGHYRQT